MTELEKLAKDFIFDAKYAKEQSNNIKYAEDIKNTKKIFFIIRDAISKGERECIIDNININKEIEELLKNLGYEVTWSPSCQRESTSSYWKINW